MPTSPDLRGIIPPIVTPLTDRDTLDLSGLERLIERLIAAGAQGIFVLGTTGEGPSLSHRLRREMVLASARLIDRRLPLYVGITDTSLVDALDLARCGSDAGAAAAVAAPPFYFPAGQTELRHWFECLVADLPLPLVLYNIPGCTKIAIGHQTLAALISRDSIIGLKDSSGDLDYFADAMALAARERPGWPLLMGPEHLLAEAMKLGATGGVAGGANLAPGLFVALFEAIRAGNQTEADRLQALVMELQQLYTIGKYGSAFLKSVKCALDLRGVCSGRLAAPFDAFLAPERERVAAWLDSFAGKGFLV
jgi:dihydrodipicolinate synthase/N-acetylneuraminate lyase